MTTPRRAARCPTCLLLLLLVGCGGCPNHATLVPPLPPVVVPEAVVPNWPFAIEVRFGHPAFGRQPGPVPQAHVDIVGVTDREYPQWANLSVARYWSPGSSRRLAAVQGGYAYGMALGAGRPQTATLRHTDPIWRAWEARKAKHLLVIASYPRLAARVWAARDPRQFIAIADRRPPRAGPLPGSADTVFIDVTADAILCRTPPPR